MTGSISTKSEVVQVSGEQDVFVTKRRRITAKQPEGMPYALTRTAMIYDWDFRLIRFNEDTWSGRSPTPSPNSCIQARPDH